MAISRPLLFALIGALVLLVATTGLRLMGSGASDSQPTPSASTATPAQSSAAPAKATGAAGASANGTSSSRRQPSQGASRPAQRGARSAAGVPVRVARALDDRKVVVLFFGARGSDDRETRKAARTVRGPRTAVFTDSVYHLDDYTRLVGALPLTQVPATVIVDHERKARVIEGFADAGTLQQLVADVH